MMKEGGREDGRVRKEEEEERPSGEDGGKDYLISEGVLHSGDRMGNDDCVGGWGKGNYGSLGSICGRVFLMLLREPPKLINPPPLSPPLKKKAGHLSKIMLERGHRGICCMSRNKTLQISLGGFIHLK
jgi:hypothetical protein